METERIGWGVGGVAFLALALFFLFSNDNAIGIALLALGVVFVVNAGRGSARRPVVVSDRA